MKYANKISKKELVDFLIDVFYADVKKIKIKSNDPFGYTCYLKNEIGKYELYITDFYLTNPKLYSEERNEFSNCWINFLCQKFGKDYVDDYNKNIDKLISDKTTVYLASVKRVMKETENDIHELEEDIKQLKILYEKHPSQDILDLIDKQESLIIPLKFDSGEYIESIKNEYIKTISELKSKKIDLEPTKEK